MGVNQHGVVILWFTWMVLSLSIKGLNGGRYRYCWEGCCPEEFCAYHTICYPKTHCLYGCPDGTCQKNICMPPKPCAEDYDCGEGNICTVHLNLGYNTCQYNLDIGKTLCFDRDGNSLMKPEA